MEDDMKRDNFICECHSEEHQVSFYYDEEDKELLIAPHLYTHKNFFKRLWVGIRFAFGYKSRFGEWDCIILDPEKLKQYLKDK